MEPVRCYGDALAHITVTRSATAVLQPALDSLAAATRRPVHRLHVDTGGAAQVPGVHQLHLPEDVGRAAALDRAVAALDGDIGWIALAEPHVTWGVGALDVLLAAAARRPRAGLLAPRLCTPDGRAAASAGPIPSLADILRGRLPAVPVPDGPVGWVASTCLLARRSAWDSVDGFDARYPGTGRDPEPGDVDLGERLGRAGWLVIGVPGAEATIHAGAGQGMLDTHDRGLRRYVHDRHAAPVRAVAALLRRGRED